MTWYYYSGPIITPIPVGDGEVKAIRPFTSFEVHGGGSKLDSLKARGYLRVCGMPVEARGKSVVRARVDDTPVPPPVDSQFSEAIVSEGAVRGSGIGGNSDDGVKQMSGQASRGRKRHAKPGSNQEI